MDMLEHLLRSVQAGETHFKPSGDSEDDMRRFQEVAEALVYAQQRGFLRDCMPRMDSTRGIRLYEQVLVLGGITYPGRQYLADIDKRNRTVPDTLADAMYGLPLSGDETLDGMLRDAIAEFRHTDKQRREQAVHRLWDVWERLVTLQDANSKPRGTDMLIDHAADEPEFRQLLKDETDWLKNVGNDYRIRHHHTRAIAITRPEHYDYLFHRLLALLNLFLVSLRKK